MSPSLPRRAERCQEARVPRNFQEWELAQPCPEPAEGMAEIEFTVLALACLKGRNPRKEALQKGISAYEEERNAAAATNNLRFTIKDARTKLGRLYPDNSTLTNY